MLLKFAVENFKSFDNAAALDLVCSTKIRSLKSHVLMAGDLRVLRMAAMYGANAAGKSNFLEAMKFARYCAVNNKMPKRIRQYYCKVAAENEQRESTFEFLFETQGRYFDYGFSIIFSRREIQREWLVEITDPRVPKKSSRTIFEWNGSRESLDYDKTGIDDSEMGRLRVYAHDFAEGDSPLFIAEMGRGRRVSPESSLNAYRLAFDFFARDMVIVDAGTPRSAPPELYKVDALDLMSQIFKTFDTGIAGVEKRETTMDDLRDTMDDVDSKIIEHIASEAGAAHKKRTVVARSMKHFLLLEFDEDCDIRFFELKFKHDGSSIDFSFSEESDGTRRVFDFLDLLLTRNGEAVFIVDEIDRSLHPMLTRHLIELFTQMHSDDNSQLIFTTHEDALMRDDLLRRDEIWFIERDSSSKSKLYSLDQFKERSDATIDRAYLKGRYGGVPVIQPFFDFESGD